MDFNSKHYNEFLFWLGRMPNNTPVLRRPSVRGRSFVRGKADGDPLPLGCPPTMVVKLGETSEERAFRRFPVTKHKPNFD